MNIALITHDDKKLLLENFCIAYSHVLNKHQIFSIDSTADLIKNAINIKTTKLLPMDLGGFEQLASLIINNEINLLIFLRDPDLSLCNKSNNLINICDIYNIPLATNLYTAKLLLTALDSKIN